MPRRYPFERRILGKTRLVKRDVLVFAPQLAKPRLQQLARLADAVGHPSDTEDVWAKPCLFRGDAGERRGLQEELLYDLRHEPALLRLRGLADNH